MAFCIREEPVLSTAWTGSPLQWAPELVPVRRRAFSALVAAALCAVVLRAVFKQSEDSTQELQLLCNEFPT